eukprot:CAMPEP_0114501922 /NCGR_PEP_ID=MMETSP0109-20121206/8766_1 /TAXON_ID=29199 /ORGANISM="Chlorarachnion reptans, Strain CCCM449" /LENGTH=83 /DNA_ID=CAMNT_0001679703 /DNA_START=855 /DNA_END=1103 /DNA_ORIENTATION=+
MATFTFKVRVRAGLGVAGADCVRFGKCGIESDRVSDEPRDAVVAPLSSALDPSLVPAEKLAVSGVFVEWDIGPGRADPKARES